MNRVQEQKHHLALANRQIAELTVQIVRQRVTVKHALDTGQRSEMAESLLDALEGSLRLFEKAPDIFAQLQRQPAEIDARVLPQSGWPGPKSGLGHAFACLVWIVVIHVL